MNGSSHVPEGPLPALVWDRAVAPQPVDVPATPWGSGEQRATGRRREVWSGHRWSELLDGEREQLAAVVERVGLNLGQLVDSFHLGRNRYGWAVMFGEALVGGAGVPVEVLGERVIRHHLVPVRVADVPARLAGDGR